MVALRSLLIVAIFHATASFSVGQMTSVTNAPVADDTVLLFFTAPQDQASRSMQPVLQGLSDEGFVVRHVDLQRERSMFERWRIDQVPTVVLVRNGREFDRVSGTIDHQSLRNRIGGNSGGYPLLERNANQPSSMQSPSMPAPSIQPSSPTSPSIQPTSMVTSNPSPSSVNSMGTDPMTTTIRIKVEDGEFVSFGTGTIVDQKDGNALVLTCGHLFRDMHQGTAIHIEAPIHGQLRSFPAQVLDYQCDEVDIALIYFQPGIEVPVAKVAPTGNRLAPNQTVFSIGCDGGADPTRRDSYITKLNRYLGPPNIEASGAPVQGRSGGGLFDERNQLIGVCYASDAEYNEGLYTGTEIIHQQLQKFGLNHLIAPVAPPANQVTASSQPQVRSTNPSTAVSNQTTTASNQQSNSPASRPNSSSVTIIVRDQQGREQTFVIDTPSQELLKAIATHGNTRRISDEPPPRVASR